MKNIIILSIVTLPLIVACSASIGPTPRTTTYYTTATPTTSRTVVAAPVARTTTVRSTTSTY